MDIVLFTCGGREHLLPLTWRSFEASLRTGENRIIVAIDGPYNYAAIDAVEPDIVIQSRQRQGYIQSIRRALRLVESEVFFWLEDDWRLERAFALHDMETKLLENHDWVQMRLSKCAPLGPSDLILMRGIHRSSVGFSANPSLCRTNLVNEAFRHVSSVPRGKDLEQDSFEIVISKWVEARGLQCAVLDPGQVPAVEHLGYLESTGREWHMTSSIHVRPKGDGYLGTSPPVWRRLLMLFKLSRAAVVIGARQLFSDAYYELAFRISIVRR